MTTEEYRLIWGVLALLGCLGLLAMFAWISNTKARARGWWRPPMSKSPPLPPHICPCGRVFIGRASTLIKPGDAVYWDHETNTVCKKSSVNPGKAWVDTISLDSQKARDMARVDAANEKPNGH